MIKITKNIIFASLIILLGLMIPPPSLCQTEGITKDDTTKKDTVITENTDSPKHDYSIIFFGGVGPEFSLYKSKYISPVFIGGIEIPLFCSGSIALELIIDHIDTKLKWELGYPDSDNPIDFIYALKFYFFETGKSRFSFRLGSWYYIIFTPVLGFEYNYILNEHLELGASVYKNTTFLLGADEDNIDPSYFTINFRFKIFYDLNYEINKKK